MTSVPPSDQMRASGSGRRKVALPPGRSQLDWVRNQAHLPYIRPRTITTKELRQHRTRDDAWTAINGKVFNVTHYVEYHPGGIDMILAGAGKDATKLFEKYHAWVNPDFMLSRCYLGVLDPRGAGSSEEDSSTEEEITGELNASTGEHTTETEEKASVASANTKGDVEAETDALQALHLQE